MNLASWAQRLSAPALAVLLCAGLVTGCGGGTTQVDQFKPARLLNFGDELSLLSTEGKKYTVNAVDANGALSCASNPLWTQAVATYYGLVYAQCNPNGATSTTAQSLAVNGAKVADVIAHLDAFQAGSGFQSTDLVTVLVGTHDVVAAYAQYPAKTEDQLSSALRAQGQALAQRVNALTALGPRVLVSTALDLSVSPWALSEKASHSDTDRAALLNRLTKAFNAGIRGQDGLVNDGSKLGLLLANEVGLAMAGDLTRSYYGIGNNSRAACTAALPNCTTATLISGATATDHLWADDTRPGSQFHVYLGRQATQRLAVLPF